MGVTCSSKQNVNTDNNIVQPPMGLKREDSWFHELTHGVGSGLKYLAESVIDSIGSKLEKDVNLAEKAVLHATKHLNVPHTARTCIPGVYSYNGVHEDLERVFESHIKNELGIVGRTQKLKSFFKTFEGKERTYENYEKIWEKVSKELGLASDLFSSFPKKLDGKQLMKLVAVNPFVTMGLSYEEEHVVFDATRESSNPLTACVFANLPKDYATAKLWIQEDFQECHLEVDGKMYNEDHTDWDTQCRVFITNLLYFFELVHAVLHVYAYIMLGAAEHACADSPMESFMHQYEQKVLLKYLEVKLLLIAKGGLVVGGYWPADYKTALNSTTMIFKHYAKPRNAQEWFNDVFLAGNEDLIHNPHLLPQARPYVSMMKQLAYRSTKMIPKADLERINERLGDYMSHTAGKGERGHFSMTTYNEWIQCQGMCGILHGNTLSISRLIMTPYNRFDGDWDSNVFEKTADVYSVVCGTLIGLEEEHQINETKPVEKTFQPMMEVFQSETAKLQNQFWDSLDEDDKEMYGWMYSVWGPNMLDNTQLTITTYV